MLFFAIDQQIEILKFTFLFREKKTIDPSRKSTFVHFDPMNKILQKLKATINVNVSLVKLENNKPLFIKDDLW